MQYSVVIANRRLFLLEIDLWMKGNNVFLFANNKCQNHKSSYICPVIRPDVRYVLLNIVVEKIRSNMIFPVIVNGCRLLCIA